MPGYGTTLRCAGGCGKDATVGSGAEEQFDRYGIYAGVWHETCWAEYGYSGFVFDPLAAGESLEEEDY